MLLPPFPSLSPHQTPENAQCLSQAAQYLPSQGFDIFSTAGMGRQLPPGQLAPQAPAPLLLHPATPSQGAAPPPPTTSGPLHAPTPTSSGPLSTEQVELARNALDEAMEVASSEEQGLLAKADRRVAEDSELLGYVCRQARRHLGEGKADTKKFMGAVTTYVKMNVA